MNYRSKKDYYLILGLQRGCSVNEIRKTYRALVKKNHPDLARDEKERLRREVFLKELNEAHEVLTDPYKRTEYDARTAASHSRTSYNAPPTPHRYNAPQPPPPPPPQRRRPEPPEIIIRDREHLLRIDYVRTRFTLKHDIGYYIKNNLINVYTSPEGYVYTSVSELERAQIFDRDPSTFVTGPSLKCAICGVTDASLRERYFVHNTGMLYMRKMRIRGGLLCSHCREKEKWVAVAHNLLLGWWGLEALVYNIGFIAINIFGGFRGMSSTKKVQEKLRQYSLENKKYDVFRDLKNWHSRVAASLPNYLVDQLLYNNHQTLKAALLTILVIIIVVKLALVF